MDEWLEIVRREAGVVSAQRQQKSTLVVTSFNPDKHAVKGTLQPHGVETGWIPVSSMATGAGYGVAIGPCVGDQMSVEFENGDPNTPVATGRLFSASDTPPKVGEGEVIIKSKFGHTISLTKDGKLSIAANGDTALNITGKLQLQSSGDLTISGSVAVNITGSGSVNINP